MPFQIDSSLPLTIDQLMKATGCSHENAIKYLPFIQGACKAFDINTELRLAAFLSQIGHESTSLGVVSENLNYSAEALRSKFGKYFPTSDLAIQYARKPKLIASRIYANRMGNSDESSGEGWLYRGRGFIQLTGKNNVKALSDYFGEDFVSNPDKLLEPIWCALSAGWFWNRDKLNALADKGDVLRMSKQINLGNKDSTATPHGLEDRQQRYSKALAALKGFDATYVA